MFESCSRRWPHTHTLMSGCRDFAKTVTQIRGTLGDFKEEIVLMSSLNNGFTIIIIKVIYLLVWSLLDFALSLLSFPDFIHCFSLKVQKMGTKTFFGLNIINWTFLLVEQVATEAECITVAW